MLWSATASSFGQLLLTRACLGAVTAAAGPVVASLVGDWFPGAERGRIYGFILTGELVGAGVGFAVTGDIAALSWRAAFVILALPAFVLAWFIFKVPEPARGGSGALQPEPPVGPAPPGQPEADPPGQPEADPPGQPEADPAGQPEADPAGQPEAGPAGQPGTAGPEHAAAGHPAAAPPPDPASLARSKGIQPDPRLTGLANRGMGFIASVRYVLAVRTNVVLIISSACGYYFLTGVQTFGTEFVSGQYRVTQVFANLLLLVVGAGAVVGVLVASPSDMMLRRGHLDARITVAAIAATATTVLFIPALVTHSILAALPYVVLAGATLAAQNPPIDAARLDIMPSWLWGRAEGIRTFLRTAAQALAPVLFGAVSGLFGGGTSGLRTTFAIMLLPLAASAFFLFHARRSYPSDLVTAAELTAE